MRRQLPLLLLAAVIALWLGYWLTATRYALLDDALIHLHYADLLHRLHVITFDGVHPGYGTSSLLYVWLLAALRGWSSSPLLPKVVSDIFYVGTITTLLAVLARLRGNVRSQLMVLGMLLCLLSPMGIRWLTDGMETSLTCLVVLGLAMLTAQQQRGRTKNGFSFMLLVLVGAALVFERIELALLAVLCSAAILQRARADGMTPGMALLRAAPLTMGAAAAILSLRIVMGHLLPDTALAKSGGMSLGPLGATLHVMASSLLLGVGCALCELASLWVLVRRLILRRDMGREPLLKAAVSEIAIAILQNISLPIIVLLACLRGQSIQGVRYVLWPMVFGITANALQLARIENAGPGAEPLSPFERGLAAVFCLMLLCGLPLDWRWASAAMRGRAHTFLQMRAGVQSLFRDKTIVAADVGFITYFTEGRMCDLAGLVDGREMAAASREHREQVCAAESPAMMFLTAGQVKEMKSYMDLTKWRVCGVYDFTNIQSNDRHYILVPDQSAAEACGKLHFSGFAATQLEQQTN